MMEPRTPEQIYRYGKDVIEKHCNKLFSLDNGTLPEVIDENNQIFRISDYRDWKDDVIDFIKNHDPDRIDEIERLFNKFEILFIQGDLSKIIGILDSSIRHLKRQEKGVSPDNTQMAQTTNGTNIYNNIESLPIEKNPPKEKKTIWERVWKIIRIIATIIGIIAAIATIIGVVYNIFFDK